MPVSYCYNHAMKDELAAFRQHVIKESANPKFLHHKWFATWHLEVVQRIAVELCDYHPEVDRDFIELLVWLHDTARFFDFDDEYSTTLTAAAKNSLSWASRLKLSTKHRIHRYHGQEAGNRSSQSSNRSTDHFIGRRLLTFGRPVLKDFLARGHRQTFPTKHLNELWPKTYGKQTSTGSTKSSYLKLVKHSSSVTTLFVNSRVIAG